MTNQSNQSNRSNFMNMLTRWRISRCHDEGKTLPPALRDLVSRSAPLDRYARTLDVLDRELSESAPIAEPPAELIRRTLESISHTPHGASGSASPARAPLWPLVSSMTVAAIALMLFVARPWHTPGRVITPRHQEQASRVAPHLGSPEDDRTLGTIVTVSTTSSATREAAALVEESREFAHSLLRDALPFATGPAK